MLEGSAHVTQALALTGCQVHGLLSVTRGRCSSPAPGPGPHLPNCKVEMMITVAQITADAGHTHRRSGALVTWALTNILELLSRPFHGSGSWSLGAATLYSQDSSRQNTGCLRSCGWGLSPALLQRVVPNALKAFFSRPACLRRCPQVPSQSALPWGVLVLMLVPQLHSFPSI